jgi:ABC-2 type transport system permease protein/oleandomycin transport system permease protein
MTPTTPAARPDHGHALGPVRDALAIAGRNLITLRRVPSLLVFSTIQPVVFLLLFRYVFGGVVQTSQLAVPYVDYLLPGILVQTTVFGAIGAAIGLATDLQSGLVERFRSLPMARSAVLAGRTLADLARNVVVVALMVLVGVAVGCRIHTGPLAFLGALLVVLVFASSMSWLFATHQPISVTTSAVRALILGGPTTADLCQSLTWTAAILTVSTPLAIWHYRRVVQ